MFRRSVKRTNLLEMSSVRRSHLIEEVRVKLRQKMTQSRLERLLLEAECLYVDGNVVYDEDMQLGGFYVDRSRGEPHFYFIE